jgi:hypothetical protein
MYINRSRSIIEENQILLELTDSENGALEHFLDENALLGMDHLVIALFQFTVDVDVFNV